MDFRRLRVTKGFLDLPDLQVIAQRVGEVNPVVRGRREIEDCLVHLEEQDYLD